MYFCFSGLKLGIVPISIPIFFIVAGISHMILKKQSTERIFYMSIRMKTTAGVQARNGFGISSVHDIIRGTYAMYGGWILLAARTKYGKGANNGRKYHVDAYDSAAVIGGAKFIRWKEENILGSVLGALFITVISNFGLIWWDIHIIIGLIIKKGCFWLWLLCIRPFKKQRLRVQLCWDESHNKAFPTF